MPVSKRKKVQRKKNIRKKGISIRTTLKRMDKTSRRPNKKIFKIN